MIIEEGPSSWTETKRRRDKMKERQIVRECVSEMSLFKILIWLFKTENLRVEKFTLKVISQSQL